MITGTGMYVWILSRCEGGDPDSLARVAKDAGLSHVLIKIADGTFTYNDVSGQPPASAYVDALRRAGIDVWGWQYVYGNSPTGEADVAIRRVKELGLDVFVIDAEAEYKNKSSQAVTYMNRIRTGLPGVTLGLSSFRFPSLHREFPWVEFLSRVDFNLPQVYWVGASNAGAQLRRSVEEFKAYPLRPIIPTGAAYVDNTYVDPVTKKYWRPTPGQVQEFMTTCAELGLTGYNFWEWANTRAYCPELWEVIAQADTEYPPSEPEPEPEPITQVVRKARVTKAINSGLYVRYLPGVGKSIIGRIVPGEEFWVLGEEMLADGSLWVNIGHHQWAAFRWKNPATGLFVDYMEWM